MLEEPVSSAGSRGPIDDELRVFQSWLREQGFKTTTQRDDIARVFLATRRHVSVEELYAEVKKVSPRVGYATVYRTVRLLRDCGLANESHFNDGEARYERAEGDEHHHDHMICEHCGRIVEFESEEIEALQEVVARAHGFTITRHRHELYGLCRACRRDRRS